MDRLLEVREDSLSPLAGGKLLLIDGRGVLLDKDFEVLVFFLEEEET